MRMDKLTNKFQLALSDAQSLAVGRDHQFIEPTHVMAALLDQEFGLIDNWLRHVQDVYQKHQAQVTSLEDEELQANRLCELNVIEQVVNVARTTILRDAWQRGQSVTVHGWVYGLSNGQLRDLGISVDALDAVDATQAGALAKLSAA